MTANRLVSGFLVAALVQGCSLVAKPEPSTVPYVVDTLGIVVAKDTTGPGERYTLADGRLIDVPADGLYLTGDPEIGDLLVIGLSPTRWLDGAREGLPGCFPFFGSTRTDAAHVYKILRSAELGDVMVVFPKAATWIDRGHYEGRDELLGSTTCVNERGEATEQRF